MASTEKGSMRRRLSQSISGANPFRRKNQALPTSNAPGTASNTNSSAAAAGSAPARPAPVGPTSAGPTAPGPPAPLSTSNQQSASNANHAVVSGRDAALPPTVPDTSDRNRLRRAPPGSPSRPRSISRGRMPLDHGFDPHNFPTGILQRGASETPSTLTGNTYSSMPVSEIERGGLLTIIAGVDHADGPQKFIVSLDLARRISPLMAWNINTKAKTKRLNHKVLHLPVESSKMVGIILLIAHFQHATIPDRLEFPDLVDLAVLTARFGLHEFLMPWIDGWLEQWRQEYLNAGFEEWLWISFTFGREREYRILAKQIAFSYGIDKDGTLVRPDGTKLIGRFPQQSISQIKHLRRKTIDAIFRTAYEHLHEMTANNTCVSNLGASMFTPQIIRKERNMCTHINQGDLRRQLEETKFYPSRDPVGTRDSLKVLLDRLNGITEIVARIDHVPGTAPYRHTDCDAGARLKAKVKNLVEFQPDPVNDDILVPIRSARENMLKTKAEQWQANEGKSRRCY